MRMRKANRKRRRKIIGIDEAGRGPLAGPVVVAGVLMSCQLAARVLVGIRDSKKLSAKQREQWFDFLTGHPYIRWAIARVSPAVIDRINIYHAAQLGACRVYRKLAPKKDCHAMLDGSLHLPRHISHETIIKGDELIPIISAASIIAKVTRDRMMLRLHKKYPAYRFDLHKGYSTVLHREMIAEFGRCEIHRKSFQCGVDLITKT
ncbi:MAG: ribonuclease HII [Candidatus Sungbacteria bacterium]|nr:ribonuclease HII [Candidatus Sungbacteria bacterium]